MRLSVDAAERRGQDAVPFSSSGDRVLRLRSVIQAKPIAESSTNTARTSQMSNWPHGKPVGASHRVVSRVAKVCAVEISPG